MKIRPAFRESVGSPFGQFAAGYGVWVLLPSLEITAFDGQPAPSIQAAFTSADFAGSNSFGWASRKTAAAASAPAAAIAKNTTLTVVVRTFITILTLW